MEDNLKCRGIYSSGKGDFFPVPLGHLFPKIGILRLVGLVHKHFYSYLKVGMHLLDHFVHN